MWELLSQIFPYVIAYTIPMLVTSLGGLYSERSGVTNLGLEGLMLSGYFGSAFVIKLTENVLPHGAYTALGLAAGVLCGILVASLHAFASINLKADQTISGTAINMLAAALTVYVARLVTGSGNIPIVMGIVRDDIPFLSKIPVLGVLFFRARIGRRGSCLPFGAFRFGFYTARPSVCVCAPAANIRRR